MTPADLATFPLIAIDPGVDIGVLDDVLEAFSAQFWPPADAVERLVALTELERRVMPLRGVRVLWAPWEARPGA